MNAVLPAAASRQVRGSAALPATAADGPPLRLPMLFFATAIVSMVVAGVLLAASGTAALTSGWAPETLALTHLGTLGVLTTAMCGASYQLVPVLTGRAVRWRSLAYGVHAMLSLGALTLVAGVLAPAPRLVVVAMSLLGPFVLAFVVPVSLGLRGTRDPSVQAMQIGQLSLGLLALVGLWMAHGHSGGRFPGERGAWITAHASAAFLGWVGATLVGVSWRVIPMFFLSEAPRTSWRRVVHAAIALGVLAPLALLAASGEAPSRVALAAAASPAVLAVWAAHPVLTLRALRARRRPRVEPALVGWSLSMLAALGAIPLSLAAVVTDDARAPLALGWVVIAGWGGLAIHAMLLRVVPFLVWLHRHAPRVGEPDTPSVRQLLPDARAWPGLASHGAALLVGLLAIATGSDALARLAGVALVLTGALLARALRRAFDVGSPVAARAAR